MESGEGSPPPARNPPEGGVAPNPHQWGFGPIPLNTRAKSPPPCTNHAGVLGSRPTETRVENPEVEDEGESSIGVKADGETFPPLKPHPFPLPSHPPPPWQPPKPRFANLSRFLGYFHKSSQGGKFLQRRTYSQVVRAEAAPTTMVPPVHNRGGGRDGFGSGRQGRGGGRTSRRNHVWQRMGPGRGNPDREGDSERHHTEEAEGFRQNKPRNDAQEAGNMERDESDATQNNHNWERAAEQEAKKNGANSDTGECKDKGDTTKPESSKTAEKRGDVNRSGCRFCGLKNRNSEECMRKPQCEICGYNNHTTFECRREPLWNYGPELCAAQVENQSFFYIEENKDPRAVSEKASTAIITILAGYATSKQIEDEFKNSINVKSWRWSARKVADNKFTLRFPDANMVQVYSTFKSLGMKEAEAQIKVEPWTSGIGAKGELQLAWFRIRGIPSDQRSIKTIAKIGGLVGKTITIDERTRMNTDYVRVRIACRDINLVSASAESSLGLKIYDFFYEREVEEEVRPDIGKTGIRTDASKDQPSPKKIRTENTPTNKTAQSSRGDGGSRFGKEGTYKQNDLSYSSAPAKISWENKASNKNTQTLNKVNETVWEESDESDNFSLGINDNSSPPTPENEHLSGSANVGLMRCTTESVQMIHNHLTDQKLLNVKSSEVRPLKATDQLESAESLKNMKQNSREDTPSLMMEDEKVTLIAKEQSSNLEAEKLQRVSHMTNKEDDKVLAKRTSTRLQKDIMLTTEEKNLRMGKKRNLEGTNLNTANSFSALSDNVILHISAGMGITLDDSNFTAIDLLKDLEIARHTLIEKQKAPEPIIEETSIDVEEEEISDPEPTLILTPRKKGKPRNRLSLSGPRKKKKGKENPQSKMTKEQGQGTLEPSLVIKSKKGKKKS